MTLTPIDVQGRGYIERAGTVQLDSVNVDGAMLWTDDVLRRESHFGDCWTWNVERGTSCFRAALSDF
jgi:hypothetical protein